MIHMKIGPDTVSTWSDDRTGWIPVSSFTVPTIVEKPLSMTNYEGPPFMWEWNITEPCECCEPEEGGLYLYDVYVVNLFTHGVTVYQIVAESEERAKLQAWENYLPIKAEDTTLDDHDIIAVRIDEVREG